MYYRNLFTHYKSLGVDGKTGRQSEKEKERER
jgi:hypothetical protein